MSSPKQYGPIPKKGDYVKITYDIIDDDKPFIGKYLKIRVVKDPSPNGDCLIYVYGAKNIEHYFARDQVEIIAGELYESPLYKALQE
jgi:hypothetical protein